MTNGDSLSSFGHSGFVIHSTFGHSTFVLLPSVASVSSCSSLSHGVPCRRKRLEAVSHPGEPLVVLRDVSLALAAGENAAILGPSGSGKSTLLSIIGTLERPTGGRVLLDGQDPASSTSRALAAFRNRQIGFVFQDHYLLPQCSVLENVLMPTVAAGRTTRGSRRAGANAPRPRRPERPARPSAGRTLRRRAATCGPRPGADQPARAAPGRRAHRQPRPHQRPTASAHCCWNFRRKKQMMLIVVTHSERLAALMSRRWNWMKED